MTETVLLFVLHARTLMDYGYFTVRPRRLASILLQNGKAIKPHSINGYGESASSVQ